MRVAIIGCGDVGSTVAYTLMQRGDVDEVMLFNRKYEKALGTAIDLNHASAFHRGIIFTPHSIDDVKLCCQAGVIVITVGVGLNQYASRRTDLIGDNSKIFMEILSNLKSCKNSIILVITNPVDNMTYMAYNYLKTWGIGNNQIIGLGTAVESARYRSHLAKRLGCMPSDLRNSAIVLGEHGDSMVLVSSLIGQKEFRRDSKIIKSIVSGGAYFIRKTLRSGPKYSIALCANDIISSIVDEKRWGKSLFTVSSYIDRNDYYGLRDISISLPTYIGKKGIEYIKDINLNKSENAALLRSAKIVKNNLEALKLSLQCEKEKLDSICELC